MLPKHIAIIMDGNNRWATERGVPGAEGHRQGARALKACVKESARLGIQVLSVFAFSSENWQRPAAEVNTLMSLFLEALNDELPELHEQGVQVRFIGDLSAFSDLLQEKMQAAMLKTSMNQRMVLVIAVNYGGQWDIVQAARCLAEQVSAGQLAPAQIDVSIFHRHTALSDLPPPDLCIRTSGEQRISNFFLWQLAYTEFYFEPCYWPDFNAQTLQTALEAFAQRKRRFGGK